MFITEILIILALILFNGLFAMAEIAIVSARKIRLEAAANEGDRGAEWALKLAQSPNRLLSTVQIGITLIGIITGVFSGAEIAQKLSTYFNTFPLLQPYSLSLGLVVVIMVITFFSLILGELVPKRLALAHPERIAKVMARPMHLLSQWATPLVWLLSSTTDLILSLLRVPPNREALVTEEEITALIAQGATTGVIDEIEEEIVKRVFHLGERSIDALMTHRHDVVWLKQGEDAAQHQAKILAEAHSVYPVCQENLDTVLGIVHVKDLLAQMFNQEKPELEQTLRPVLFVPENMKVYKVLQRFQDSRIHCAMVLDEYGSVLGLVTLNDLLSDLVSDVSSHPDPEAGIVTRADGSWLVEGQLPFEDFADYFDLPEKELAELEGFRTVAGFLLALLEQIPQEGVQITWGAYTFEVVDMDHHRIDKVLVSKKS